MYTKFKELTSLNFKCQDKTLYKHMESNKVSQKFNCSKVNLNCFRLSFNLTIVSVGPLLRSESVDKRIAWLSRNFFDLVEPSVKVTWGSLPMTPL